MGGDGRATLAIFRSPTPSPRDYRVAANGIDADRLATVRLELLSSRGAPRGIRARIQIRAVLRQAGGRGPADGGRALFRRSRKFSPREAAGPCRYATGRRPGGSGPHPALVAENGGRFNG